MIPAASVAIRRHALRCLGVDCRGWPSKTLTSGRSLGTLVTR
jgi:hypothetical protein